MPTPAECWHRAEATALLVNRFATTSGLHELGRFAEGLLFEPLRDQGESDPHCVFGGWRLSARRVSPIRQINVLTRDLPDGQVWVARFGNGYRHPSSCPGAFGEPIRTAWRALL